MSSLKIHPLIFILIVSLAAIWRILPSIDTDPYVRWDEWTNVQVVTDTLAAGSFPTLMRDGEPFFEKPPLWYFMTMIITSFWGIHPLSMRVVSAVSGILLVVLTTYIALRWYGFISSVASAIVMLLTPHLYDQNPGGYFSSHTVRSADVDALQQLWILIGLWVSSTRIVDEKTIVLSAIFASLGVLTKGPLGIVPILFLGIRIISERHDTMARVLRMMGVFLLITTPWYAFMILVHGETFIQTHIGYHLIARIGTSLEGHRAIWWYPLKLLSDPEVFPFGFIAMIAACITLRYQIHTPDNRYIVPLSSSLVILIIALGMHTKLAWYIMPIYPYLSLMIGLGIQSCIGWIPNARVSL